VLNLDDHSDDKKRPHVPRIEVFAGSGRRRWSDAVRAQIVAESLEPGAVVVHVARRHGCRPQQVHEWRKLARTGQLALPETAIAPGEAMFVPLLAAPASPSRVSNAIAVELDGAVVRIQGRPDREALVHVFAALRRSRAC
jgi:transposase